jgi:hypothetical protein
MPCCSATGTCPLLVPLVGSCSSLRQASNFAADRGPSSNLKAVDIQVRPVHHWQATRVKAHVFLSMLVYYVEYHMRIALPRSCSPIISCSCGGDIANSREFAASGRLPAFCWFS